VKVLLVARDKWKISHWCGHPHIRNARPTESYRRR